jgi:DnaK suppressor protein
MTEELSDAQRAELHATLLSLQEDLRRTLRTTSELAQTVELDQAAVGRLSRVDALQQQAMAAEQAKRYKLRLRQVAVALQTVADDAYGECKKCGEPIGYRRLRARPESPCCVPCMAELERGH